MLVRPVRFDGGQWIPQREVAFRPGAAEEMTIANLASDPHTEDSGAIRLYAGDRRHGTVLLLRFDQRAIHDAEGLFTVRQPQV
jgi:hypothetical protein